MTTKNIIFFGLIFSLNLSGMMNEDYISSLSNDWWKIDMNENSLSLEQRTLASTWFDAYQQQKEAWLIFENTPAGQLCEIARLVHKKYQSPQTEILKKVALYNAMKLKIFNDFLSKKNLEQFWIKKLNEVNVKEKTRQRKLVKPAEYIGYNFCEAKDMYGTLPLELSYTRSNKHNKPSLDIKNMFNDII